MFLELRSRAESSGEQIFFLKEQIIRSMPQRSELKIKLEMKRSWMI